MIDFHDLKGVIIQKLVRIFWLLKIFMGLSTWQKYVSRAWFKATPQNVGMTKFKLDRSIFKLHKIWKRHWIGNSEWKIIVFHDIQPNLTKKCSIVWEKKNFYLLSVNNTFILGYAHSICICFDQNNRYGQTGSTPVA